jgi:hypothetical protein
MKDLAAPERFDDAVNALIEDWRGQDEIFFHQRAKQTIAWWIGRAKSLDEAITEIRKPDRRKFVQSVCAAYGIQERRAYEALAVYRKYAKRGDDAVPEITERIFQDAGGWSKALPKKEETAEVEPKCAHCKLHCHES